MHIGLSHSKPCDICLTSGQEVRIYPEPYSGEAAIIVCTDAVECDKNMELASKLDSMAEEYKAQHSFEAGSNPWAL